ncbi:MAG: AAA family ATPase [Verrucomicrobiota bacterium]
MSSTRTAEPGSKPRQERFMSSAEFQTGLMANIVAHRCSVEKSSKKRELIYRIQADSHKIGLKKLSEILIERFRDRIATRTMLKPSYCEKKTFSIQDTKEIRKDVPSKDFWDSEILRTLGSDLVDVLDDGRSSPRRDALPQSFSAKTFKEECEAFAESKLESFIEELCLNPEIKLDDGPWYFPDLIESLFEHYAELAAIEAGKIVKTGLAKTVHDAMDYSLHSRDLVLVDGRARTGKSTAAKNWVQTHIGQARFAEVPPGDSDIGFFRVIAKALGLSSNLNHKAHELRDRIESVLRTGDLLLCLDESQF